MENVHSPPAAGAESARLQLATLGAGCFWCSEAIFRRLKGVHSVVPGYCGGRNGHPTYEQVCSGATGHAEVVQITYDPAVVSYAELLEVFWRTHDPTTPNRQGNDVGTQYRSVVFYHDEEQRRLAVQFKEQLDRQGVFERPIVTQIVPYTQFYPAEEYHWNFYERNPRQPYCRYVIGPKLEKLHDVLRNQQPSPSARE
jgi:peptide-methionine (S)-S-oxide reductase